MSIVELRVKQSISDMLRVPMDSITLDKTLADLGADSLDVVEMLMMLEDELEEYNVKVPESIVEMPSYDSFTVGDTVALVNDLIKKNSIDPL